MNVTVRTIGYGSPEYEEMVALRYRVLREPLGLGFTPKQLADEKDDALIGAYVDGRLAGCLVLTAQGCESVLMRQVAVDEAMQGRGVGKKLLTFAEQVVRARGYTSIVLHARETAIGFYRKLGFKVISKSYMEVTLPHRTMRKCLKTDLRLGT